MGFLFGFFLILFILVAFLLCAIILVQESKSMGLGASFGGDAGNAIFGASTASVLKKVTAYMATAFMALCIILSLWTSAVTRNSELVIPEPFEETQEAES